MNTILKDVVLTTVIVIALIYCIEYAVTFLQGHPFQHPSTTVLIAAVVAANVSRQRKIKV